MLRSTLALITPSAVVAVVVTYLLVRAYWATVPDWIKNRNKPKERVLISSDANDELATPDVVMAKLYRMFELVSKLCADVTPDDLPWYKLYLCFWAYLHLLHELSLVEPNYRHERYLNEGEEVSTEELQELVRILDLAHWAYRNTVLEVEVNLRAAGHCIIRYDNATEPGRVGHFMSADHSTKTIVLAIKGTNTFSDILTDALGLSFEHNLDRPFVPYASTRIRCHEGMYVAAQLLADDIQHLLETFFLPQGYSLLVCGHSLGAGVACLLGLLLKSRLAESTAVTSLKKPAADNWLRVVAFATPACLDADSAKACMPFITSVVNNTDCVPRLSVGNVVTMNKLLLRIDQKLNERGFHANDFTSALALLSDLNKVDDDLLMSRQELEDFNKEVHASQPQDYELFVPGRVVYMWETEVPNSAATTTDVTPTTTTATSTTTVTTSATTEATTTTTTITQTEPPTRLYARALNGQMCALRQIELDNSMIIDHLARRYKHNLHKFVEQRLEEAAGAGATTPTTAATSVESNET